jgi:hypothetical protein
VPQRRFNPVSLDALNFLLADVRGALGPYLNVALASAMRETRPAGPALGVAAPADLAQTIGAGEAG